MIILAIDPGQEKSGVVTWNTESSELLSSATMPNEDVLKAIARLGYVSGWTDRIVVIEKMVSYGMRVGETTFDTLVWIGRFIGAAEFHDTKWELVSRKDVKMALCGSTRACDADVRDAIVAKHGKPGTKKFPGKLYGVSGHCWSALAVALTYEGREERGNK